MSELKFTVSYGKTVNLGNYESARFDLSIEFNKEITSLNDAWYLVQSQVEEQVKKLLEARGVE